MKFLIILAATLLLGDAKPCLKCLLKKGHEGHETESIVIYKTSPVVEQVVDRVKEVPVPYPVEKIVTVDRILENPILKHVPYPVEVVKEKIIEKPVERIVHVDRPIPVEVIKEVKVPVPFPVEIIKEVPRPVPYPVEVIQQVDRPVPFPVEVIKEIEKPVIHEVEKLVPVHHQQRLIVERHEETEGHGKKFLKGLLSKHKLL